MNSVSIEICTRNRVGELYGLLCSIYGQTWKDWDLSIIDESDVPVMNTQYIRDILNRFQCDGHNVAYKKNDVRRGIAAARNDAYRLAQEKHPTQYHLRIDDDSVCHPEYVAKLMLIALQGVKLSNGEEVKEEEIGAVGGVVPTLGSPELRVSPPKSGIFNEVTLQPDRVEVADDGGVSYYPDAVMDSHHLRSSFLFTTRAAEQVGLHSEDMGGSVSGFREETDFCMKIKAAGWKLVTDTSAVCWHQRASSGGARGESTQEYAQAVRLNEEHFQRVWLRKIKLGKIPKNTFS